jgi:hypothetical protein
MGQASPSNPKLLLSVQSKIRVDFNGYLISNKGTLNFERPLIHSTLDDDINQFSGHVNFFNRFFALDQAFDMLEPSSQGHSFGL